MKTYTGAAGGLLSSFPWVALELGNSSSSLSSSLKRSSSLISPFKGFFTAPSPPSSTSSEGGVSTPFSGLEELSEGASGRLASSCGTGDERDGDTGGDVECGMSRTLVFVLAIYKRVTCERDEPRPVRFSRFRVVAFKRFTQLGY